MRAKLNLIWRTVATGFCFFVFGAGQIVQAVLIFPLALLLIRDKAKRRRLGKRVMQMSFKGFVESSRTPNRGLCPARSCRCLQGA